MRFEAELELVNVILCAGDKWVNDWLKPANKTEAYVFEKIYLKTI